MTAVLLGWLVYAFGGKVDRERARYRELFESNPRPMWVYDLETLAFLAVNNAAVAKYGYSREEFLAMTIADIRPPEDVPRMRDNVARVREGVDSAGIWRHRRKDGTVLQVEIHSHTLTYLGRRAEMILADDVTARVEAEAALRESEHTLREMAENVRDIYYSYDPVHDRLLYISPRVVDVWGVSLEKLQADPMCYMERIHPDDLHLAEEEDRRQRAGLPATSEYRVVRPDGKITWIQSVSDVVKDANGNVIRIVGAMRDITGHKQAEEELARQEAMNLRILDAMQEGVHGIDADGYIIFENSASVTMLGWERHELLGRISHDTIHHHRSDGSEYPRSECPIFKTLRDGIPRRADDEVFFRKDGTSFPVAYAVAPQLDESGAVSGAVVTFRDLTRQQAIEAALRSSERRFYELADVMPFMVWTAEADGFVDYANGAFQEFSGFHEQAKSADGWADLVHPDDKDNARSVWIEAVRTREPYHMEFRLRHRSGEYRWLQLHAVCVEHEDGTVKWYGTASDIHAVKHAEENARDLAKRLGKTLESITDAFFTLDRQWHFTYVNREAERILQRTRSDLLGAEVWKEFPAARGSLFETEYRRAVETGETVVFEAYYPPPLDTWFAVRAYPSEQGLAVYFRDVTEARKVRIALQESEERLRLVTRVTSDLIWDVDVEADTIWWGDGFAAIFGEEAPAESVTMLAYWEDRVHPDDRGQVFAKVDEAFRQGGDTWMDEYRLRRGDGTYVHVLDRGHVVRDATGKAVRMIGGMTDLTERKRAEEELRQSEERFRLLSKATNDAIWDWNLVTDALWWNEGFETLFGFSRAEIEAGIESWTSRIHPEDADFVYRDVKRAIEAGDLHWEAEYRFLKADGTYANVLDRGYVIHDDAGRPIRMVGGMTDLSDWKRSEAEREILYAAVEQLGEMVVIASPKGVVEYVNPAFERTTGYSRGEMLDTMPRVAMDETYDQDFYQRMWETVRSGQTWSGQLIHQRKDGGVFTANAVVSPVRNRDGRIVRFVGVMSDETERLKLEEQFRQSQKMEAVGRLAGGIAHDFNNMLTVILARSEKSLGSLPTDSPVRADIKEVHEAAVRSAELTRQLLAYARKQDVKPRILNLNDAIAESLKMLRRLVGEDVDLVWTPAPSVWTTRIDPVQLDQILANLCVNARDAIADVGEIRIETRNVTLDAEYVRTHPDSTPGDYVQIAVSDDGSGMDKDTLSHLFEPFFTTKAIGEGTGLGMATVYGIVQQNNGFIHVYSEPGKGTTFRIYLPRQESGDTGEVLPAAAALEVPAAKNERVLVVEDEAMILEVAVEILESLGYAVTAVTSPQEALRLVEERGILVDALITDVIMPGMNGRELADRIRAVRPGLGVLFMSGYTAQVMEHRGIVEGRDGFVQKPFSTRDLAVKLRDVLDGRA